MTAMKLPAMTKHPDGTASFYLRVAFPGGSDWQVCTEEPKPIPELIVSIEEYVGILRDWHKRSVEAQDATTAAPAVEPG